MYCQPNRFSFRDDSAEWHGPHPCNRQGSARTACAAVTLEEHSAMFIKRHSLCFILILSLFCMLLIYQSYFCLCCTVHIVFLTFLYFLPFVLQLYQMWPLHLVCTCTYTYSDNIIITDEGNNRLPKPLIQLWDSVYKQRSALDFQHHQLQCD